MKLKLVLIIFKFSFKEILIFKILNETNKNLTV